MERVGTRYAACTGEVRRTDGGAVGRSVDLKESSTRRTAWYDERLLTSRAQRPSIETKQRFHALVPPSVRHTARIAFIAVPYITPTRCAYKNNPLEKILYLRDCSKIFNETYSFYSGGFWPYVQHFSLQYLVSFKNYNNLNLKLHF